MLIRNSINQLKKTTNKIRDKIQQKLGYQYLKSRFLIVYEVEDQVRSKKGNDNSFYLITLVKQTHYFSTKTITPKFQFKNRLVRTHP